VVDLPFPYHSVGMSELRRDCPLPPALSGRGLSSTNLWMCCRGSRSSLHHDPHDNLLCVAVGTKAVTLFHPRLTACLYPRPAYDESANHSLIEFASPDEKRHPHFRRALALAQHATLTAGDALYIPTGWWHQVDSSSVTIAVNFWWQRGTGSGERAAQLGNMQTPSGVIPVPLACGADPPAGQQAATRQTTPRAYAPLHPYVHLGQAWGGALLAMMDDMVEELAPLDLQLRAEQLPPAHTQPKASCTAQQVLQRREQQREQQQPHTSVQQESLPAEQPHVDGQALAAGSKRRSDRGDTDSTYGGSGKRCSRLGKDDECGAVDIEPQGHDDDRDFDAGGDGGGDVQKGAVARPLWMRSLSSRESSAVHALCLLMSCGATGAEQVAGVEGGQSIDGEAVGAGSGAHCEVVARLLVSLSAAEVARVLMHVAVGRPEVLRALFFSSAPSSGTCSTEADSSGTSGTSNTCTGSRSSSPGSTGSNDGAGGSCSSGSGSTSGCTNDNGKHARGANATHGPNAARTRGQGGGMCGVSDKRCAPHSAPWLTPLAAYVLTNKLEELEPVDTTERCPENVHGGDSSHVELSDLYPALYHATGDADAAYAMLLQGRREFAAEAARRLLTGVLGLGQLVG